MRLNIVVLGLRLVEARLDGTVSLYFLFVWPILLTWLVRHFSSFQNFAVDQLDAASERNLPSFASKTQSALRSFANASSAAPVAGLGTRVQGYLFEPAAPAPPARLGRLVGRHLGVRDRADGLRLSTRRRRRGRPRRPDPLVSGGDRRTLWRDAGRPLPALAGNAGFRPHPGGSARGLGGRNSSGRPGGDGVPARSVGRARLAGVPAGGGGLAADARGDAGGTRGGERRLDHDRSGWLLRRAGARRRAARCLERRNGVRGDRRGLPLVGSDVGPDQVAGARGNERSAAGGLEGRGAGRVPDDRARLAAPPDRRALRRPDARRRRWFHVVAAGRSRGGAGAGVRRAPQRLLCHGGNRRDPGARVDQLAWHPRRADRGRRRATGGDDSFVPPARPH